MSNNWDVDYFFVKKQVFQSEQNLYNFFWYHLKPYIFLKYFWKSIDEETNAVKVSHCVDAV